MCYLLGGAGAATVEVFAIVGKATTLDAQQVELADYRGVANHHHRPWDDQHDRLSNQSQITP